MFGGLQCIENGFFIVLQLISLKISSDFPSVLLVFFHDFPHLHHLLCLAVLEVIGILIDLLSCIAHLVEDEAWEAADEEDLYAFEVYFVHFPRDLHGEIFVSDREWAFTLPIGESEAFAVLLLFAEKSLPKFLYLGFLHKEAFKRFLFFKEYLQGLSFLEDFFPDLEDVLDDLYILVWLQPDILLYAMQDRLVGEGRECN